MRFSLLIALLTSTLPLCAQTGYNADSVEKVFEKLPDSMRLREANNLMKFYMDIDIDKSMYYARQAFALKDKAKNESDIAYTYVSWAIAQYNLGHLDSCLSYNLRALEIYQSQGDTVKMAVVFNNLSSVSNALGDYASGAYYAYKSFLVNSAKQNSYKAAISCMNLSSAYYESGDYDAALSWARRGYRNLISADAPQEFGYALQLFADVFLARKQMDSALYYIDRVGDLLTDHPNEYLATINLAQRGDLYCLRGDYDNALSLYTQCISFYEEMGVSEQVLHTHLSIARAYQGLKDWRGAEQSATRALNKSREMGNRLVTARSCALLAEIFALQGKPVDAAEYYRLGALYKDSIMSQAVRGNIEGRFLDVKLERETQARLATLTDLRQRNATIENQWKVIAGISGMLILALAVAHSIRRASRERQRMNAELVETNHRLSELNREVNGLINTIVHDLKSPLNTVQGILSLVKENKSANGEVAELIGIADKALANGHGIIHQLLTVRELEENSDQFPCEEIDTTELVQELHDGFQVMAKQKNIALNITAEPYIFTSNRWQIRRILDNLVSNAIKFSSPGSVVRVRSSHSGEYVIFQIEDQGPGFNKDDLDKIYGRFQKLSARPTAGEHSNGLGLSTVQALVNHLNATIDLATEPGKGSVFTVTIPVVNNQDV